MMWWITAACLPEPVRPTVDWAAHDFDDDGYAEADGDCDDADETRNPGAAESCGDGTDNNCDGVAAPCGLWGVHPVDSADATVFAADASAFAGSALSVTPTGLWIGAPGADGETGRAHLVLGPWTGLHDLDRAELVVHGASPGAWFGVGVAAVQGLDGDGQVDLLVGEPGAAPDSGVDTPGAVYVFDGALRGEVEADAARAVLIGEPGGAIGEQLAGADLDGDGFGDVVIGTPLDDRGGSDAGAVYRIDGPLDGTMDLALADTLYLGAGADSGLGSALAPADVDGDGVPEILLGAPGAAVAGRAAGAVYVFAGALAGVVQPDDAMFALIGAEEDDQAGATLATTDTDDDGYVDVVVGSPYSWGEARGRVFVVSGPLGADLELDHAGFIVEGASPDDDLGEVLCAPGDVDGDGRGDLVLVSTEHETSYDDVGVAYVFMGGATGNHGADDAQGQLIGGGRVSFGEAIAGGDLDGDGYADVAVGAPLAGLELARGGAAWLFTGGGL